MYKISKLNEHTVGNCTYFLDTNVWVYFYKKGQVKTNNSRFQIKSSELEYADFVDKIIEHESAIIAMCVASLDEIYKLYLHEICKKVFFEKKGFTQDQAKSKSIKDYRSHSETDYYNKAKEFLSDIQDLITAGKIQFFDDKVISHSSTNFINNYNNYLFADYNDFVFYTLASVNNWTIITNDGDFRFPDSLILTNNTTLLDIAKK